MDDLIELLAEDSHRGWMAEKIRQNFADHALAPVPCACDVLDECSSQRGCNRPYCRLPADKHHADMLPYADLPENVKEYDRVTVRGTLAGIKKHGYVVLSGEDLRRLQEAIALLNSMLLSGEEHSDRSRAAVRDAMSVKMVA